MKLLGFHVNATIIFLIIPELIVIDFYYYHHLVLMRILGIKVSVVFTKV